MFKLTSNKRPRFVIQSNLPGVAIFGAYTLPQFKDEVWTLNTPQATMTFTVAQDEYRAVLARAEAIETREQATPAAFADLAQPVVMEYEPIMRWWQWGVVLASSALIVYALAAL